MAGRPVLMVAGNDCSTAIGGHSSYVRAHARAAVRAGFEPQLFCVGRDTRTMETEFGVVHRHRSPVRPLGQVMAPAHEPVLSAALARFAAGHPGPHLIHSFGLLWGFAGVRARARLARAGRPAAAVVSAYTTRADESRGKLSGVARAHGYASLARVGVEYAWTRLVLERYERAACQGASAVLVNYAATGRLVAARHGSRVPCRTMPYASEAAFLHADGQPLPPVPPAVAALEPAGAALVVAVSRHDPRKGMDRLLRALARVRAGGRPVRGCLVGPGPLLSAHRDLVRALRLESAVVLTGPVPDPYPYLCHADIFVLPSLQEGSGSVAVLEALQAGAAVIASRLDGIPEDVSDGDGALLIPPGDVEALAGAMARLMDDHGLRRRLAARGRTIYQERFSAGGLVRALAAVYAELGFLP